MTDTSAPEPAPTPRGAGSLGILGGTFNPPHLGHLAIARHARAELSLQRVALMPARRPPHKPIAQDPGCEHRVAMCRLLIDAFQGLAVCTLEAEREGPSYTVNSLLAIHQSHPQVELTLIAGADIASTLPAWREPQRLLELTALAVAARAGTDRGEVTQSLTALSQSARVHFLAAPVVEVSSSLVRERVASGEAIDDLVGPAVAEYIGEHGLYGARARAAS